jgi:alpha-amylase
VYLSSLRHALHRNLLSAEGRYMEARAIKGLELVDDDIWNEGTNQVLVRGAGMAATVAPSHGGAIAEFGLYSRGFDIFAVIPRRYEAYHETLRQYNEDETHGEEVRSIHDMVVVKEKGLKDRLVYDSCRRYSFKDLVLRGLPSAEDLMNGRADVIEMGNLPYASTVEEKKKEVRIRLERRHVFDGEKVEVSKRFSFGAAAAALEASYAVRAPAGTIFGVELNINLLAAHDEERYYEIPGLAREDSYLDGTGISRGLSSFALLDRYTGMRIQIESSRSFDLLRYPIYTVSQSDRGFEKNYQGSSLVLGYAMEEESLEFEIKLSIG